MDLVLPALLPEVWSLTVFSMFGVVYLQHYIAAVTERQLADRARA
jgi:hypothetical protein